MSGVSRFPPSANPPPQNPQPAQNPPSTPKAGRALPQPKVQGQQPAQGQQSAQERPKSPAREARVFRLRPWEQITEKDGKLAVVSGKKLDDKIQAKSFSPRELPPTTQKTNETVASKPPLSEVINKQPQTTAPSPRPGRNAPPLQRNNSNIWGGAKPSEQATKGFLMGVRAPEPPKPESKSTPNIPPKQAVASKPQTQPQTAKPVPPQEKSQSTPSLSRANTTETSPTKQQLTAKPAPASGLDERDSPSHSFELVRQDSQLSRQDSTLSRKDSISSAGSRTSLNPEADQMSKKINALLAKIKPHLDVPSGQKFKSENLRNSLVEIEKMLHDINKKARDSQSKVLINIIEGSEIDPENPFQQSYESLKSTYAQVNQILLDERFKQIQNEKIDPSAKTLKTAKLFAEFISRDQKNEFGMLTWLANKKIPDLAANNPDMFTFFAGKSNDPNVPYLVTEASKNIQNIKEADKQAEILINQIKALKNIPNDRERNEKLAEFMKGLGAFAAEKPTLFAFMTNLIGFPRSDSVKQLQDLIGKDFQPTIFFAYMANDPLAQRDSQIKTINEALKTCHIDGKMVANFKESIFEDVASSAQRFQKVADMKTKEDVVVYTNYLKQARDILKDKYNGWHQQLSEALKKPEEQANSNKIKELSECFNSADDKKLNEERKLLDTVLDELQKNGMLSKGTARNLEQNQDKLLTAWPESSEKMKKFFTSALHASTQEAINQSKKLNELLEEMKGNPPGKPAKWLKNPDILPQVNSQPDYGTITPDIVALSRKKTECSKALTALSEGQVMSKKYADAFNGILFSLSSVSAPQAQSGPNEQVKAISESIETEISFQATLLIIQKTLDTYPKDQVQGQAVTPPHLRPYLDLYNRSIEAMANFQKTYTAVQSSADQQQLEQSPADKQKFKQSVADRQLEQFISVYLSDDFQKYTAAIGELAFNSQSLEQLSKEEKFAKQYMNLTQKKLGPLEAIIGPVQRMPRHGMLAKIVQKTLTGKEKSIDGKDLSANMKAAVQKIEQAGSYINKIQETQGYLTFAKKEPQEQLEIEKKENLNNPKAKLETKEKSDPKEQLTPKKRLEKNFEKFIQTMAEKDNFNLTDAQYTTILNHAKEAAIHHKSTVDDYKNIINAAIQKLTSLEKTNKDQVRIPIINSLKDALSVQLEMVKDVTGSQLLGQAAVKEATVQTSAPSSISFAELMKQANEFSTKSVTDKTADDMSKEYINILSKVPNGFSEDECTQLLQTLSKPYRERISTIAYDELLEKALQAREPGEPGKNSPLIIQGANIRQRLMQELNESTNPVMKGEAPPLTSPNAPLSAAPSTPKAVRRGFPAPQTEPEPAKGRAGATPSRMRPQPEPTAAPKQSGRPLPTKPPETTEKRDATPTSRGRPQPVPPATAKPATEKPQEQGKVEPQRPSTPKTQRSFKPPWMK